MDVIGWDLWCDRVPAKGRTTLVAEVAVRLCGGEPCAPVVCGRNSEEAAAVYRRLTAILWRWVLAHNLMQAIARANRVFPGKDCGVIVDYNGMLKSLREALAQYALGDDDTNGDGGNIVAPIEELVAALLQAIEATEKHLLELKYDVSSLHGATGFNRIQALRNAVDAVYTTDDSKRRFEILARQVFIRFDW